MERSIPSKTNLVSTLFVDSRNVHWSDCSLLETKKEWSLAEWVANFIQDDGYYYGYEDEVYADDLYDDTIGGGEGDFEEGGVIESILIIGVMTALIFLLWWRQRMQQAHAAREAERRREQGLPPQDPQVNRPNPEDGFPAWAAGGIGL